MSLPGYSSYRNSGVSWLPSIPSTWSASSLRYCAADIYSGGTPDSGDNRYWTDDDSGVAWVAIGDMTRAETVVRTDKRVTQEGLDTKGLRVLRRGTLLYSMYASLGKVAVLGIDAAINQAILGIVPNQAKVQNGFLRYWMISLEEHLTLFSSSNTQDNLNAGKVRSFPVFVPPISEQRAIAAFLDRETAKIDALVAEQERLMALLKEKRQAVISQAVTKGLNPDAPMKASGVEWLGEVPNHWRVMRLKHLSQLISKGTTPSTVGDSFVTEGVRFLKAENITEVGVSADPEFFISDATHQVLRRSALRSDDVLVVIAGATTGKAAVLPRGLEPANTNQAVSFVRLQDRRLAQWVCLWLSTTVVRTRVLLESVQSAQPNLSMEDLGNLSVPVPPESEVKETIAQLQMDLGRVDELSSEALRATHLLNERRAALISAAVTGQIDVRHLATADAA